MSEIRDKAGFEDTRLYLVDEIDAKVFSKLRMIRSDVSAQIVRASREVGLPNP